MPILAQLSRKKNGIIIAGYTVILSWGDFASQEMFDNF